MSRWPLNTNLFLLALFAAAFSPAEAVCGRDGISLVTNNGVDDTKTLQELDARPEVKTLYFDELTYLNRKLIIGSDVTLSKPFIIGMGLTVNIAGGASLTFKAQPMTPSRSTLFTGPGQVRFVGNDDFHVFPEWWKQKEEKTLTPALQRLSQACSGARCTVLLTNEVGLTEPWSVGPNIAIWSTSGANVKTSNGSPTGLIFQAGDYSSTPPYILPTLTGFNTGILARGTKGLRAYANTISRCADGVAVEGSIESTSIYAFTQTTISTAFASTASQLKGVRLGTFMLTGTRPGLPAAVVDFRSAPSALEDTTVAFRGIEGKAKAQPNHDVEILRNADPSRPVPNLRFRINSWGGNFISTSLMVQGRFSNLQAYVKMTTTYPVDMKGPGNTVNYGGLTKLGAITMAETAGQVADVPVIWANFAIVELPKELLKTTWNKGEARDFYLRHGLLSGGEQKQIVLSPGPTSIYAISEGRNWVNPGLVVEELVDESNQSPYRLRVRLRNLNKKKLTPKFWKPWLRTPDWRLYVGVPGVGTGS